MRRTSARESPRSAGRPAGVGNGWIGSTPGVVGVS